MACAGHSTGSLYCLSHTDITHSFSRNRVLRGCVYSFILCHRCGTPYPWTEKGITAARELISEAENFKPEQRESLSKSLDDLIRDSPGTQVAAIRFKKFISKAGKETADALRKI